MASNRPRRKQTEEAAPKAKKGGLNTIEMAAIALFVVAFLMYTLSKCGDDPVEENTDATVTESVIDSNAVANNSADSTSNQAARNGSAFEGSNDPNEQAAPERPQAAPNKLYIIIDSLKLRTEPNLSGTLVDYLRYGEEVEDMGGRTVLEKIRVSVDEIRTAPWVQIKTKKGKKGWAFGAYIQFYPVPTETNLPEN